MKNETLKFEDLKEHIATKSNNLSVGSKFYIPFKDEYEEFVIIGINENLISEDKSKNYIDLMSTRCLIADTPWKENYSQDDYDGYIEFLHYCKSDIIQKQKEQEHYLPEEIRNIIIPRKAKFLVSHNTYTNDKEYSEFDIGNIWLPSLKEVFGFLRFSDSCPEESQYSYFKYNDRVILEKNWWLRSAGFACRNSAFYVLPKGWYGNIIQWACGSYNTVYGFGAPICFRLEIDK